ncbi:MAG: D-aminoacyl-tRNA deacylase [Porphyromonadaceae bacterium]|nr:D-aminoacyl-tRNA deacylase [Porphyromonadaceae bacterium]
MRIVIQKVTHASVSIGGEVISKIDKGLMVLLGIENGDTKEEADNLAAKLSKLRIFEDEKGVMNLSVIDVDAEIMVVSQFTLLASTKKGNRPSYIRAAKPDESIPLYEYFCQEVAKLIGKDVPTGQFGADMQIELVNDGPTTIVIDTRIDL